MSTAEGNAMSERILKILENIIASDFEIEEFAIVPTEENTRNKCPILYEQHNIGLESWCVKHVYQYACSTIFQYQSMLEKKTNFFDTTQLNRLLMGALLINPDVYTFWNIRRKMVEIDLLTIDREFYFSSIVLTHKSKSNEAFSYRRWLLKKMLNKFDAHNILVPMNLLQNEFAVINRASEKSPNNYHSWNHRIWCIENLAQKVDNFPTVLYEQLRYSEEWINMHVSEHSGFHYRQYLIKLILNSQKCTSLFESYYSQVIKRKILYTFHDEDYNSAFIYLLGNPSKSRTLMEMYAYVNYVFIMLYDLCIFIDKLNSTFPDHESVYYHRRFLIRHLLNVSSEYHSEIKNDLHSPNGDVNLEDSNKWPKRFKVSSTVNKGKLQEIVLMNDRNFCNNNRSAIQVEKYKNWLKNVLGLEYS